MQLFFFLSGMFAPSSLDRKGVRDFLADRLQRLGIPAVAWYFTLGPWHFVLTLRIVFGITEAGYSWMVPGPPWFICWLMTFNMVYAFLDNGPVKVPMPSVGTLLLLGLAMGYLETACKNSKMFNMPRTSFQLISNALAFSTGILAKRSSWLEELEAMPAHTLAFLRVLVAALLCAKSLLFAFDQCDHQSNAVNLNQDMLMNGLLLISMPIVLIDLFRRHFNGGGCFVKACGRATFLVYIIHPFAINLATWSFVALARAGGFTVVKAELPRGFGQYNVGFLIQSSSDGVLWLAFSYSFLVSNILVWPLAHFLRKLPVMRDVF